MSAAFLYQWVLAGPCVAECLSVLSDACLCRLSGWLRLDYDENEKTGEVLGMCMVEQAARFAREHGAGCPGYGLGQGAPATLGEREEILT